MTAKNARVDIKTTKAAKATLEQAADMLGTTLSAFILDCAMSKARKVVAQSEVIYLTQKEAKRFATALEQAPKANDKLKLLFKKHSVKQHKRNEKI